MTLPYENATSGERALGEIQKLLRGFGCNKFGSMRHRCVARLQVRSPETASLISENKKLRETRVGA